jgi:calcium/calmodulin-dependent protein kinase I
MMLKHIIGKESTLFQPPSFIRKRNYEQHQTLGAGTFGQAVVRTLETFSSKPPLIMFPDGD